MTTTIDWNPLILAGALLLTALASSIPGVLAYLSSKRTELKTAAIMDKVDGNYSALKADVNTSKAETIEANNRIKVLIERLINSTPMATAGIASLPPIPVTIPVDVEKTIERVDTTTQETLKEIKKL